MDIGERRVAENGMVPDVKEIRCEFNSLPLGQGQVLDQGHISILLERSAIFVASESAEAGGSSVVADDGRRSEGVDV